MSTVDSQILISKLTDLTDEIKRCVCVQRDTLKDALYSHNYTNERVNQCNYHVGIIKNQVENDLQNLENEKIQVFSQLRKCNQATKTSYATLREVESALQSATDTLKKWKNELNQALEWLEKAEARMELAIKEYEAAEANLERAKTKLERAEAALRSCINDRERSNCNSESRAYELAKVEALNALTRLESAEIELRLAQEEVEKAKARVNCCNKAVNFAEQAVSYAAVALENANQAVNSAERSLEEVEASERHLRVAEEKVKEEQEIVEDMNQKVVQGENLSNQAFSVYLKGYEASEYSQRLATLGCQDIAKRMEELYRLNYQEALFSNPVTGEIVYSQPLTCEVTAIPGIGLIDESAKTPSVSDFAKNLNFKIEPVSNTDFQKIIAINPRNNEKVGFLEFASSEDNKVRIIDTQVPEAFQGRNNPETKGIGSMLFQNLEKRMPNGTEIYFFENLKPEFWEKMGFMETNDEKSPRHDKIKYYKLVFQEDSNQ